MYQCVSMGVCVCICKCVRYRLGENNYVHGYVDVCVSFCESNMSVQMCDLKVFFGVWYWLMMILKVSLTSFM